MMISMLENSGVRQMQNLIEKYFYFWNDRNLIELKNILDPNVTLQDWNINVTGQDEVLNATKEIFDNFPEISINIEDMIMQADKSAVLFLLQLDALNSFRVVDWLYLRGGKISAIKAYKVE